MTQVELAKTIDVCPTTLSRMLSGKRKMNTDTQIKLWCHHHPDFTINGHRLTEWREVFRQARIDQGISLRGMADKAGYAHHNAVIAYETKNSWPKLEKFKLIANTLSIKLPE